MVSENPAHAHRWRIMAARKSIIAELALLAVLMPEALLLARPALAEVLLPLLTLVPVLCGVRYGFVAGSAAALLLMLVLLQLAHFPPEALHAFPKLQAAVYLLCGSLAGQFHDYWARTLCELRAQAARDRLRLAQFTGTFHVLKASHAQLERRLAGSRTSLRSALQRLKDQMTRAPAGPREPLGGLGAALLELLAESCHLHSGTAYEVGANGLIAAEPAASFGQVTPLSPFHPMLREALGTGSVVSVRANDSGVEQILAVVPLVDSLGHIHGVISVNQMAFIAIHQHTLDLMAVIARHAGDMLASRARLAADAGSNEALLCRLRRSMADAHLHRLPLAVVGFRILEGSARGELVGHCLDVHRGIDQSWLGQDRLGQPVVVVLMPMPDEDAAHRHVQRLRTHVAQQCGATVASAGIEAFVIMLEDDRSAEDALADILHACDAVFPPAPTPAGAGLQESTS
jgi:hypothetical protein